MSGEDRGIVRVMFRSMSAGPRDATYIETFGETISHPDIEYREDPSWPGTDVYRGRDTVIARFRDYLDLMAFGNTELEELIGDDDVMVAFFRMEGVGSGSGSPFVQPWAWVIGMDEGYVRRLNAFLDRDEALRAAGMDRTTQRGGR
jgi:ketosteroid isomerase-like protein